MGLAQREKGKRGEREVCAIVRDLLGVEVRRRVRQDAADSDVIGLADWSIEVKNAADMRLPQWWRQACDQAQGDDTWPALFYKVPRQGWRVRWPLAALMGVGLGQVDWLAPEYACDSAPEAWAATVRELAARHGQFAPENREL